MADTGQVETAGLQKVGQNAAGAAGGADGNNAGCDGGHATACRARDGSACGEAEYWLLASVVFLAAVLAAMIWYAGRTDWRVLFSGLDGKDVQQVSQELAAAGIPFEMTADGAGVQVPAEMLDKARMEVAAKGMPQTGRLGFELFDKPNWVGSEFDEKVNYQRALEGELEHTIAIAGDGAVGAGAFGAAAAVVVFGRRESCEGFGGVEAETRAMLIRSRRTRYGAWWRGRWRI